MLRAFVHISDQDHWQIVDKRLGKYTDFQTFQKKKLFWPEFRWAEKIVWGQGWEQLMGQR